ncbi:MAG: glycosyltransferase family 2 protein [Caulobacteraceae bacterium]
MLKDTINIVFVVLQILFFAIGFYYFFTSVFGLAEKIYGKATKNYLPLKRFAIFIPAHNEEVVIGNIVDNLKDLNYPRDSYDVFVIADNCSDNTASVASAAGANVLERFDDKKKGKGYALQWAFEKILYKDDNEYDAAVIFDADNLVSKNFLKEMNNKLCSGLKVVQGYIDSKNPNDSWITASYSIAFWSANRLFQCARSFLGMSCEIGGTGFCMDVQVLKQIGWQAACLVEDLEFTMKLMLNNIKVGWAHEAVVYDEKPLTLAASWRQRRRWMQGFADVCSRYFMKLFIKGIKERNAALIDCAVYTLQPYVILVGAAMLLIPLVNAYFMDYDMFVISARIMPAFFKLFGIVQFLMIPVCLYYDRKLSYKLFLFYPTYILYCLTWIPISIQGIVMMKNKEWSHTLHTRKVTIHELE